jgi:hypothetical protein
MRPMLRFTVPALAAVLALGAVGGASAQTVLGLDGQSCGTAGFNYGGGSGQATCQVFTPVQLSYPQVLVIAPTQPSGATPVQCIGTTGAGYTTQATVSAFPTIAGGSPAGYPDCAFDVTSGVVPQGAPVGTEIIGLPYYGAGGSVQQTATICGDPSCATTSASGFSSPNYGGQYSAFTPPAPPSFGPTFTNSQPWWQNNQSHNGRDGDDRRGDGDHDGDDHGDQGHGNGHGHRGDDGH